MSATYCAFWGNRDSRGTDAPSQIEDQSAGSTFTCCRIQDADPNDNNIPFGGAANGNIYDDPLSAREDCNGNGLPDECDVEACCFPGGNSSEMLPADCSNADGTPQGPGTSCAQDPCSQ